mgnify:FL=1
MKEQFEVVKALTICGVIIFLTILSLVLGG